MCANKNEEPVRHPNIKDLRIPPIDLIKHKIEDPKTKFKTAETVHLKLRIYKCNVKMAST